MINIGEQGTVNREQGTVEPDFLFPVPRLLIE